MLDCSAFLLAAAKHFFEATGFAALNSSVRLLEEFFMKLVFWLPSIFVVLHIFEEFVWPGGFSAWFKCYRAENAISFTPIFALRVNALLIAATLVLGWMGPTWSRGASLWLTLAALLAGNALFHLVGVLRLRRYSPGVVTGVLLYLPLAVWGFWYFTRSGEASSQLALTSFALGSSYELWSIFNHRRRAAAMSEGV